MPKFTRWMRIEDHATDEQLLSLVDGELVTHEAGRLKSHLARCWSCQARLENLKASIIAFMDHRNAALLDNVPDPPGGWSGFDAKLRCEANAGHANYWTLLRLTRWAAAVCPVLIVVGCWASPAAMRWAGHMLASVETVFNSSPLTPPRREQAGSPPSVMVAADTRLPVAASVTTPVRAPATPQVHAPDAAELEAAEVAAWYALHRLGACRGEQVEVMRSPSGDSVTVRGLVDGVERRRALILALGEVANVRAGIRTFEEAMRQLPSARGQTAGAARVEHVARARRLGAGELTSVLRPGVSADLPGFSREVVSLASAALQEAWALRRLSEAFPPARVHGLNPTSRRLIEVIAHDHTTVWHNLSARLSARLNDAIVLPSPGKPSQPAPADMRSLFESASSVDRLTRSLFADSDEPSADPERDARELTGMLSVLETRLGHADEVVRLLAGPPLTAAESTEREP